MKSKPLYSRNTLGTLSSSELRLLQRAGNCAIVREAALLEEMKRLPCQCFPSGDPANFFNLHRHL